MGFIWLKTLLCTQWYILHKVCASYDRSRKTKGTVFRCWNPVSLAGTLGHLCRDESDKISELPDLAVSDLGPFSRWFHLHKLQYLWLLPYFLTSYTIISSPLYGLHIHIFMTPILVKTIIKAILDKVRRVAVLFWITPHCPSLPHQEKPIV